jgi:hypothetical protein
LLVGIHTQTQAHTDSKVIDLLSVLLLKIRNVI